MPQRNNKQRRALGDVFLGAIMAGVGVVVYLRSLGIPSSPYEKNGAAFLPKLLSLAITAISLIILGKGLFTIGAIRRPSRQGADRQSTNERAQNPDGVQQPFRKHPYVAVSFVGLLAVYIASMQFNLIGYRLATILFVAVSGLVMSLFERKRLSVVRVVAIVTSALALGIGLFYLFTRVFSVGLT